MWNNFLRYIIEKIIKFYTWYTNKLNLSVDFLKDKIEKLLTNYKIFITRLNWLLNTLKNKRKEVSTNYKVLIINIKKPKLLWLYVFIQINDFFARLDIKIIQIANELIILLKTISLIIYNSFSRSHVKKRIPFFIIAHILIYYFLYSFLSLFVYIHIFFFYSVVLFPFLFLEKKAIKYVVLFFLFIVLSYIIYANTDLIEAYIRIYHPKIYKFHLLKKM